MTKISKWSLALVLFLSLFATIPQVSAKSDTVTVSASSLNVRTGPGLTYSVIGSLQKGQQINVLSQSGDWYEIDMNGNKGWIATWLTQSIEGSSNEPTVIVSRVDQLNVRSGPSTGSAVIARMQAGDEAMQNGQDGEWIAIILNGTKGWVHSDYVSLSATKKTAETIETVTSDQSFTVSVDALNVRNKPDLKSKKVGLIHKDESYTVKQVDGNWLKIAISDKKEGWVYLFHGHLSNVTASPVTISTDESQAADSVTILSMGTNIRESASTSSEIVTRADAGEKFPIVNRTGDWYEISLPNGQAAFVANWVVSTEDVNIPTVEIEKKAVRVPGTLKGLTIVVDPGHGGNDRGTTGVQGTDEKDITLQTAELVSAKLKAAGAEVIMTRESDTYVALRKRVAISHHTAADAFISIHYDANPDASVNGFTTYYTHSHQKALATKINDGLDSTVNLRNRGSQPADFLVLRENRQNAVLIELGFLSNSNEERAMTTNMFREQAAHGIYNGLLDYFDATE